MCALCSQPYACWTGSIRLSKCRTRRNSAEPHSSARRGNDGSIESVDFTHMTLNELLAQISVRDIRLRKSGDELLLLGSQETLDSSLASELRAYKPDLLRLIGSDSDEWWKPSFRITPEMVPLVEMTPDEIEKIVRGVPGGAENVQDIYPLAPLQEGILFHHLMSAEGDAYLLSLLLAFDTRERLERFIGALQAVIDRHDILRTAVVWEGLPEPVQVVWREAPLRMEEVHLNPQEGEIERQLLSRFDPRRYRLDIGEAPLMRAFAAYDVIGERW